jgi:hypothetical protein
VESQRQVLNQPKLNSRAQSRLSHRKPVKLICRTSQTGFVGACTTIKIGLVRFSRLGIFLSS